MPQKDLIPNDGNTQGSAPVTPEVLPEKHTPMSLDLNKPQPDKLVSWLKRDASWKLKEVMPPGMNPEHFMRSVYALIARNPRILDCTPSSVYLALVDCAELGFLPSPMLGMVYFIPYGSQLQCQLGYQALIQLMLNCRNVSNVYAELVYKQDKFRIVKGTEPRIEHEPSMEPHDEKEEDVVGAYAVVTKSEGNSQWFYLNATQIRKIRDSFSHAWKGNRKDSPWHHPVNYKWMYLKTVLKQISKFIEKSPTLQKALATDTESEAAMIGAEDPRVQERVQEMLTAGIQGLENGGTYRE